MAGAAVSYTHLISGYTLWAADADGARELLDGQRFWHLFAAKDGLVLVDDINPADPESDSRVWYLPTGSTQPTLVWSGDFSLYITEADQIAFISWAWSLDSSCLLYTSFISDNIGSHDFIYRPQAFIISQRYLTSFLYW